MRFRLFLGIIAIAIGALTLGWYSWNTDVFESILRGVQRAQDLSESPQDILPLAREVITPPPLRGPKDGQLADLTASGVFHFTNVQRAEHSITPLTRNSILDRAASNKLNDLFARQYFDHISPTGEGPSDGVTAVGYTYIKVGENLALGNFASDAALVQAWMDSPGHRANILASGFQEIGIAIGKGIFEGEETWIAVQTFATPESACPLPAVSIKNTIEANQVEITQIESELDRIKQEIERLIKEGEQAETNEERRAYQKQIEELEDEYNEQVAVINNLITETKKLIEQYNSQVQTFNTCIQALE